jgi:hypothetical protein
MVRHKRVVPKVELIVNPPFGCIPSRRTATSQSQVVNQSGSSPVSAAQYLSNVLCGCEHLEVVQVASAARQSTLRSPLPIGGRSINALKERALKEYLHEVQS